MKTLTEKFDKGLHNLEFRTSNIFFKDPKRQSKRSNAEIKIEVEDFKQWLIQTVREYNKEVVGEDVKAYKEDSFNGGMNEAKNKIRQRQEELI